MTGKVTFQALMALLMPLLGCSQPVEQGNAAPVKIEFSDDHCILELEGHRFAVGQGKSGLAAFLKTRKGSIREVHIIPAGETPYRCVGPVISSLQAAGVARIGFISEPPGK